MRVINAVRFLRDLESLANIGRLAEEDGGGLDRRPFSHAERQARAFFRREAAKANLEVRTDGASNISAVLPSRTPAARTLLIGSHLDTVPNGGRYDGALGVVAALEVLRTVQEIGVYLPLHLEAIAFVDEEGRFGDFFGSQALRGSLTGQSVESFLAAASRYPDDLAAIRRQIPGNLQPDSILDARRSPASLAGMLELHIEQGPQLEKSGVSIGIVNAIFGRRSMRVRFHGRSDHAGTTPMADRADALLPAANFISRASQIAGLVSQGAVITCGRIAISPGVVNVVPGEVTVSVEFRAASEGMLDRIEKEVWLLAEACTAASSDLAFSISLDDYQTPVAMNKEFQSAIHQACLEGEYSSMAISSGALHDAGIVAGLAPAGMIFVPSKGGRSHNPAEDTDTADLVIGANVLLNTVLILADQDRTARLNSGADHG